MELHLKITSQNLKTEADEKWQRRQEKNSGAIADYNRRIASEGVFSEGIRKFYLLKLQVYKI